MGYVRDRWTDLPEDAGRRESVLAPHPESLTLHERYVDTVITHG